MVESFSVKKITDFSGKSPDMVIGFGCPRWILRYIANHLIAGNYSIDVLMDDSLNEYAEIKNDWRETWKILKPGRKTRLHKYIKNL